MSEPNESPAAVEEDVTERHKKERQELQAKVANLKRDSMKEDKKKKRLVMEEIARLQADLNARHDKELNELENNVKKLTVKPGGSNKGQVRVSKAQRRRDKKEQKNQEREQYIIAEEQRNLTGPRHVEAQKLGATLALRDLQTYEIPSDGDCLYGAVSHQLFLQGIVVSVSSLRKRTAQYIRKNKDEFLPFLCDSNNDAFEDYCLAIETTPAWGGQLELRAISQALQHPIEVIQATGQPLLIGEEFGKERLVVTYHRHEYGLGEHFNSVSPRDPDETTDDFS